MKTFAETLNIAPIDAKMMSQPAETEEAQKNNINVLCSGLKFANNTLRYYFR